MLSTLVITSDGSLRGRKTIDLKSGVDEGLEDCPGVKSVLVAKRINSDITLIEGRDQWLAPLMNDAEVESVLLRLWMQTETGGIMISPIPDVAPTKPTYATLPLPGIITYSDG